MTVPVKSALVVDDSPTIRNFVSAALESAGFDVTLAKSGFEALKVLKEALTKVQEAPGGADKSPFDLIVTDVNMPDINGLELVKFVRQSKNEALKRTPLVIISTDGREKDRDRGMALGATAYLVKPFQPEVLLELASRILQPGFNVAPQMAPYGQPKR
jgi:two-component system chemotaxis response regulator CheY